MRSRGFVAYLIYGCSLLALYVAGGFGHWWRNALDLGSGGGGRSFWGGGGFRGGK